MIDGVNNTSSSQDPMSGSTVKSNQKDALTDKSTFLTLLVAQIKNQDPLQPQDGVQFISQLAQFTNLEQSMNMNNQLTSIHDLLAKQADTTATGTTPPVTGS
jgi:flagellar basal-body rod modification protein FlgD